VHEYVLTLLVTTAVTYLLTPLVRRGAVAARVIAVPRERDVHTAPVPLLGGLAMYGGLAAGLAVADQLPSLHTVFQGDNRMATGLLAAGGLIVIVGVVDDRWGLSPISKAAGQAAAGGVLVWSGAQLSWLPEPGNGTLILTPNQSTVLTIFLVVATINAVNFIDGLDGLAAGIVCIAAVAFFVYYYRLTQLYHQPEQAVPALASAVLAGACLGFLPHNFYPAKIFMGDTGAMLLGLLLAYVPISSIASIDYASLTPHDAVNRFPEILPLLLPAAILVIPYTDLLLAVVRRARAGLSPMAADQKHLHHRLLEIGHSHRSSVLIMYLWAGLFSSTITWLSITRTKLFFLAVTTLAAVLALLLMSMPRLRPWRRRDAAQPPSASPAAASPAVPAALPVPATLAVPAAGPAIQAGTVPAVGSGGPAAPWVGGTVAAVGTGRHVAGAPPDGTSAYTGSGSSAYPDGGGSAYADNDPPPYAGSGSSPYADTGSSPYADTGSSPYADTGSSPYADGGSSPYGGDTPGYTGSGSSPYGDSGEPAYGGDETPPYAGNGTSPPGTAPGAAAPRSPSGSIPAHWP
jgi:UDP-GlcNAc:undecaprenyl-phosphate GlcNAc-1-phosphate transferase